jgi:hypothetical protein
MGSEIRVLKRACLIETKDNDGAGIPLQFKKLKWQKAQFS